MHGGWRLVAGIVAAAWLVGVATVSAPFFASSTGTALLQDALARSPLNELTLVGVRTSDLADPDEFREARSLLRTALEARGLPEPRSQTVLELVASGGTDERLHLIGVTGASAALEPAEGDVAGFVAPDDSAATLGVEAGDRIRVGADHGGTTEVLVSGESEAFRRGQVPPFWRPVSGLLTADPDPRVPPPPPALLGEPDQVLAVLDALGAGSPAATVTFTSALPDDLTLEQTRALVSAGTEVRALAADPTSELGGLLSSGSSRPALSGTQVESTLARVEQAAGAVVDPVRALGLAGRLIALAVVAVVVSLVGRRSLSRGRLWQVRGVPPSAIGLRWGVAAIVPTVVGIAVAHPTGHLLVSSFGPAAPVDPGVREDAWLPLTLAGAAVVLTVVVTVSAATWRAAEGPRVLPRVPLLGEALLVLGTAAALIGTDDFSLSSVDAAGIADVEPLALVAPALVFVTVAVIGTRLVGLALGHLPGRRSQRPSWYLVSRRLRSKEGAALAVLGLVAVTSGALVFAGTLSHSVDTTIREQVALTVGADAALPLSRSLPESEIGERLDYPGPTTTVRISDDVVLGAGDDGELAAGQRLEMLVVDPSSFAEVAFQPDLLADTDVADLVGLLAGDAPTDPLPAIAVGTDLEGQVELSVRSVDLAVEVVDRAPAFPGLSGMRPAVVVPAAGSLYATDRITRAELAVAFEPSLWIDRAGLQPARFRTELDALEHALDPTPRGMSSPDSQLTVTDDLVDRPGLAPTRWTFTFLHAQAVPLAILGCAVLVVHARVRQRDRALGSILAERMGLARRTRLLADALELLMLTVPALALGWVAGQLGARVALRGYAPLPDVDLPTVVQTPPALTVGLALGGSLVVAGGILAIRRAADRRDASTLLREGG